MLNPFHILAAKKTFVLPSPHLSKLSRFQILVLVSLLSLSAILLSSLYFARARSSANAAEGKLITNQSLFFPYWSVRDGFNSTVGFNNASNTQLVIYPTLYDASGQSLAVSPIVLGPKQQFMANISDWITESDDPTFREGNLNLSYEAPGPSYLGSQITITNPTSSLVFDVSDEHPVTYTSSQLEGVWWRPDIASSYNLILTNTTDSSVETEIVITGDQKSSAPESLRLKLGPHQTQKLNFKDVKLPVVNRRGEGTMGGISITHTGKPGAVLAYGMLAKSESGFSSDFAFADPSNSRSQTLVAAHVLIGSPDTGHLLPNASFTAITLLRNASDVAIKVKPTVSFTSGEKPQTVILTERELLPQQIESVDLGAELKQAGLRGPFVGAGLTLTSTGKPGSLVTHLTSYDRSGNHVFDAPLRDPAVTANRLGGAYPWNVEGDNQSIIHVRNTADEKGRFTLQLDWDGGSYALPMQEIEPQQEIAIDIRHLRDAQVKDSIGRVIPMEVINGQARWHEHGKQAMVGRMEVFNVLQATASSFSCEITCCPPSTEFVFFAPGQVTGGVGSSFQAQLLEMERRNCDDEEFGPFDVTAFSSWMSNNQSVATVVLGEITCVGVGSTDIIGSFQGTEWMSDVATGACEASPAPVSANCPVQGVDVSIQAFLGVGKDQTANVQVTLTPSPIQDNVTLILSTTSGTGAARFATNNSTTLTISQSTSVGIKGMTESSTADNIQLEARIGNESHCTEAFSVVLVTLSLRTGTSNSVSMDNSARATYISFVGSASLGTFFAMGEGGNAWGTHVEIVGTVKPANYVGTVRLEREIVEKRTYANMTLFTDGIVTNEPDNSLDELLDTNPQSGGSNGKVYDLDGPNIASTSATPLNAIRRRRTNFRQWATIDGVETNDPRIKASADFFWFQRLSIIKTTSGDQLQNDVSGDNVAGAGTTSLSWNLQ